MNAISRSWEITKISFSVITQDKEMLVFPLLAGICSILFSIALLFPTIIVEVLKNTNHAEMVVGVFEYALIGITYLGISFFATFFNVCVVYTAKVRFSGGDATFMDSIRFSLSKIGVIFAWSLVSATVGLILNAIDNAAERMGGPGKILVAILHSVLGLAWTVVSIFVVPAMVYESIGPFEAINRSVSTIKSTWGESLVRHYGLGFIFSLFMFLGIGLGAILMMSGIQAGPMGPIAVAVLMGLYFLIVVLLFTCANTVFNVALYAYANQHPIPNLMDEDVLSHAFAEKQDG